MSTLPPTTKREIHGIKEEPPGSGIYWVDCYVAGRRIREIAGTKTEALKLLQLRKAGVLPAPRVRPAIGGPVKTQKSDHLSEVAAQAFAVRADRLGRRTIEDDRLRWEILEPLLGQIPVGEVRSDHIEQALARLRKTRNISGPTANRYRQLISSILSYAVDAGIIENNPCRRVKRYKENPARVRFLQPDEEAALRKVIRENCPHREPELDIALNTGARRGEQFMLTWDKVELDRGVLEVCGKTGARRIEINPDCRHALLELYENSLGSRFVIPEANRVGQRDSRRWFERCLVEAKIDNFRWHDLRHTFASRLVMAGVDLRTVMELLGHTNIVQTMKYAHLSNEHKRAAVDKLSAAYGMPAMQASLNLTPAPQAITQDGQTRAARKAQKLAHGQAMDKSAKNVRRKAS